MSEEDYQFPVAQHLYRTPLRQSIMLVAATLRVVAAVLRGNLQRATQQVWQVKRECETLHRILSGRGADVELGRRMSEEDQEWKK